MVSSLFASGSSPQPATAISAARAASRRGASKLGCMRKPFRREAKNYSARAPADRDASSADWDATFVAAMDAIVPREMGGMRLDQALARLFPQYSRSRLQTWLKSGHITLDGKSAQPSHPVAGGERIVLEPPPVPELASPQAQRMPLKVVHEDAQLIVIGKPAGLVVHPGAGQPDRTLLNALLAHAPALAGVPRAGIVHRP